MPLSSAGSKSSFLHLVKMLSESSTISIGSPRSSSSLVSFNKAVLMPDDLTLSRSTFENGRRWIQSLSFLRSFWYSSSVWPRFDLNFLSMRSISSALLTRARRSLLDTLAPAERTLRTDTVVLSRELITTIGEKSREEGELTQARPLSLSDYFSLYVFRGV